MSQVLYDNERSYWEQRLGDDVPLNSVGYHGLSDAYVSWLYRIRERRFLATAAPLMRPGMRVLDVGSGGGFYVSLWRRLGAEHVTATDLTEASLRAIGKRFPGTATLRLDIGADTEVLEDGSFDAISCMDVLHHLMDDGAYERAMANCARLLKPGGSLIFTDNFLHGPAYRGPHHVSRPLIYIERVLRGSGFSKAVRKPMFVVMNNPIDSRSPLFAFYWKALSYVSESPAVGRVTGAALYPIERILTSVLKEGPSTEICVATRH